jgi:hypothetical protein
MPAQLLHIGTRKQTASFSTSAPAAAPLPHHLTYLVCLNPVELNRPREPRTGGENRPAGNPNRNPGCSTCRLKCSTARARSATADVASSAGAQAPLDITLCGGSALPTAARYSASSDSGATTYTLFESGWRRSTLPSVVSNRSSAVSLPICVRPAAAAVRRSLRFLRRGQHR